MVQKNREEWTEESEDADDKAKVASDKTFFPGC